MEYSFAARSYRLPLRTPLRTAHGVWAEREGLVLRLEAADGSVGYGEIAPVPHFSPETLDRAAEWCRRMGDRTTDAMLDIVPEELACVRFAVAQARSRKGGVILSEKRLPVTALLPAGRAVLDVLPGKIEQGFLSYKWKVGVGRAEDELGLLDDLLANLPSYTKLRLDANGGWDRRTAEKWLSVCAERPVEFVEQPVAPEAVDVLQGLAEDYPVLLALDESVAGLASARAWQERGWRGVYVIKPALAGPLEELAAWATSSSADLVLSSAIETVLGRTAILRAVFTHDLTKRALGFGIGEVFGDRRWDGPAIGPLLDAGYCDGVEPEELWNALN